MKLTKRIILLALISSLFLAGCGDDGGFSIAKSDESAQQETTMGEELKGDKTTDNNANSGATGVKDDEEDVELNEEEANGNGSSTGLENTTPAVDLGNQITTFTFTFIKSEEEGYANVTFADDPFDKTKYDFSYYTVNEQKLEKSEYRYKEIIDDVETYKIYVGSNESGTYVLKFYNSKNKQYGRTDVNIQFKNVKEGTPYISVAFNLVRVRFVSLSFSIQSVFKKIGDFFSNLFNGDKISIQR